MKKFMRIALVFALAGATLVGCTKDYSGDISDLNKKVAEQQSAVTALQNAVSNAQTAADAAAATANTALSTAKAAATAEELNAVKAELAKAATADALKAVDDKYAAYIPAIEAAAKAVDLEEFKALVAEEIARLDAADTKNAEAIVALQEALTNAIENAQAADKQNAEAIEALEVATATAIAATNVRIDDVVAALAKKADKTEFDAAVERILALETNYIKLEARVLALEKAEEDIRALIAKNEAGIEANAEDIEALQKKVNELISDISTALFTIDAPAANVLATVEYAEYRTNNHKEKTAAAIFNEIAKAFPEVAEIEDKAFIEQGGHIPFMVSPAETVLDDSFEFELVNYEGEVIPATISNPQEGFYGVEGYAWGTMLTKGGNSSCWTLDFDFDGYDLDDEDLPTLEGLALCADNGEAAAQTAFAYTLAPLYVTENVAIKNNGGGITFGNATVLAACEDGEVNIFSNKQISIQHGMDGIVVLGMPDNRQSVLAYEKYGITFDGTTINVKNYPEETLHISFNVTIAALGINGSVDKKTVEVVAFNPSAITVEELADKEVVNGATKNSILWNVADYDFTAAKLVEFVDYFGNNFHLTFTSTELKEDGETPVDFVNMSGAFRFYDSKGNETLDWSKAETFGIKNVESSWFIPGEYEVLLTISERNQPVFVFTGEGKLTVTNDPTAISVKLLDSILDENGVIEAVGTANVAAKTVTYSLKNALVYNKNVNLAKEDGIVDAEYVEDDETSWNWINKKGEEFEIRVPKNGAKYDFAGPGARQIHDRGTEAKFVNGDARNLLATLYCFGNEKNTIEFPFQAKVIDPIYSDVTVNDQVIYFTPGTGATPRATKFELRKIVEAAKYVAGDNKGKEYNVFDTWTVKETPGSGKVEKKKFKYDLDNIAPAATGYTNRINVSDKAEAQFMEDFKFAGFHEVGSVATKSDWNSCPGTDTETRTIVFKANEEYKNKSVLSKYSGNYKYTAKQEILRSGSTDNYTYTWGRTSFEITDENLNVYMLDEAGEFITIDLGTTSTDILRGFGMTYDEIQEAKYQYQSNNVKKLFLTKAMAEHAYAVWKKYYDENLDKLSAKTQEEDGNQTVIYYSSWKRIFTDYTFDTFKSWVAAHTATSAKTSIGPDNFDAVTKFEISEADNNAVDAYDAIRENFAYVYAVDAATPATYAWERKDANKVNYDEIDQVYVEFDDPVEANKFVTVGYYNGPVNPYFHAPAGTPKATDKNEIFVTVTGSEVTGGVVLGAKLVIVDQFGMKIEKPFTITIKQ